MANEQNDFIVTASENSEFQLLESGAYDAICVGLSKREFKKYKSDELEPKLQFVFQVVEGGVKHYLRTVPYRIYINESSNLYKFVNAWTGVTYEKCLDGLDLSKLVGSKAQVVVGESERDGKKYNTIENVLKAKKSSSVVFVQDDQAPAYLTSNLLAARWIDGLGFAEASTESASTAGASPSTSESTGAPAAEEDDSLPF